MSGSIKAYLALIAMNQNRLVALCDQNFQNFGNDSVGSPYSWILVRMDQDSMMSDTTLLEKSLVHGRIGFFDKSPVVTMSIRNPE